MPEIGSGGLQAPCGSWDVPAGAPSEARLSVYGEPLGGFDATPFAAEAAAAFGSAGGEATRSLQLVARLERTLELAVGRRPVQARPANSS